MRPQITNTERIRKIAAYLTIHAQQRITIADLALLFHMSETTMKAGFKKMYGVSIHQYHLNISMQQAGEKIKAGQLVKETAIQFGYRHIGNFSRAFKKVHKVSPEGYRQ